MKRLDLTINGKLNTKHTKIFEDICSKNISSFTTLIGKISLNYKNNLDWHLSLPASRNTLISDLFYYFCLVIFAKKILYDEKEIDEIYVDTPSIKNIITSIDNNIKISVKKNDNVFNKSIDFFFLIAFTFHQILKRSFQLIIARAINQKNNYKIDTPINLIDTYVIPGFYSKDRYYSGLWESLTSEEKKQTYFLPTIAYTKSKNMIKAYKELRNSKRPFLIKEDFLKFSDIIYSVFHCIRIRSIKLDSILFDNINITSLFENELKKRSGYHLAIEGLLNFRFLKRLKKAKIDIKVLLDWWESQASDKGLHRGMKVFFPHSNVIGYLGYAPRNMELQLLPSIHETNNFLVPKYIAVIGKGLIKNLKFLNPEQNVISAPAFRYQYLWNNYNKINKTPVFNILVALPITFEDTIYILNVVKKYFDMENKKNCNILIKLHPTMSKNMLQRKFNYKFPKEFKLIFGSAKDYMLTANVIISSMSIVCLESLALGIPVILVKRPHGLNFNPIPHEIKEDLWKQCVNEIDILSAINNFKNRDNFEIKRHNKIASEIRKNYFEPITRKGIANLLDLN